MTRSRIARVASVVVVCLLPAPSSRLPVVVEYPLPRPKAFPHDPAVGADGIVWYTDQANSYIGRLDAATGKVTDYATPTPASGPHGIVVAPDARPRRLAVDAKGIVWYTDYARGKLGRLDPATGQVRDFASPGGASSAPYGIAIGTDGRIWYDESGSDQIVAFDPATERMQRVAIPTSGSVVRNMAVDSTRARLWLALSGIQRLGRIDLAPTP